MNERNIKDIAYNTLFTKYIVQDLKADKKLIEIDSTDNESLIGKLNGGYPIPGMMYTFIYKPSVEDMNIVKFGNTQKKYQDRVPIVFCVNTQKGKFSGINMNVLPNLERLKFLEMFFVEYQSFFKDVENYTENKEIALNKKYIAEAKSGNGQKIIKMFNAKTGANFNYGFRSYDMKKVTRLRMIEFTEWDYIPHYEPKDAFKLMNQAQIHNLYWRNR